jgi:serine/threonine-protein kinase
MGRIELALLTSSPVDAPCVLKRLLAEGRGPEREARFRREAQIAQRLQHENIARTLRVEEIEGELCIAQEFVEGVDLSHVMRQFRPRTLPVEFTAHIVRQVCDGLHYAHEYGGHGIVHRDVTPENVMISFDGDVKLVDFGIARSAVDGTLTNIGVVVGRREYVPPEVWEGDRPDRRADIYGLGIVLWEVLTGRRLEGSSLIGPGKVPPNPCTIDATIPAELGAITERALAWNASDRYATAEEFRQVLAPFAPARDPKSGLAALLADNFKVDLMREIGAEDVADGRRFLGVVTTAPISPGKPAPPARRRPWLGVLAGLGAAALPLGLVLIAAPRRVSLATSPPVAETRLSVHDGAPVSAAPTSVGPTPAAAPLQPAQSRTAADSARTVRRPSAQADAPRISRVFKPAPADPASLIREARERWDDRDAEGALALLKRARTAGAGAPANVLSAVILMSQGKAEEAERTLVEALRLDPENSEARKLLTFTQKQLAERGHE